MHDHATDRYFTRFDGMLPQRVPDACSALHLLARRAVYLLSVEDVKDGDVADLEGRFDIDMSM